MTTQNLKQTFQSTRFSAGHLFIKQLLDNNISGIRRLPACFATFDFAKMHLISVNYSCIDVLKRDLCNSILSWLLGRLGGVRGSNRHGSWSSLTFALLGFASDVACKVEIYIFIFWKHFPNYANLVGKPNRICVDKCNFLWHNVYLVTHGSEPCHKGDKQSLRGWRNDRRQWEMFRCRWWNHPTDATIIGYPCLFPLLFPDGLKTRAGEMRNNYEIL